MTITITRTRPRGGVPEHPWPDARGHYVLGDPAHGKKKHHSRFAVRVATLKEAADLIARGFSLRMGREGKYWSLVSPASLLVRRS